jgi:hypothetical protein
MIDAMKQALEIIKNMRSGYGDDYHTSKEWRAMEALRQAIEQAEKWDTSDMAYRSGGLSVEQEPVCDKDPHLCWSVRCQLGKVCKNTAPPSKPWVSLNDRDITGAAHNKAKYPVSILETTDSGLCMQFSETGEWHASDKHGDFMKVNSFLMSFARAIEAKLKERNNG